MAFWDHPTDYRIPVSIGLLLFLFAGAWDTQNELVRYLLVLLMVAGAGLIGWGLQIRNRDERLMDERFFVNRLKASRAALVVGLVLILGLMIYHWWNGEPPVTPGARETIDVFIKNDTWEDWQGEVALRTAVGRDVPDTYPFRTLWREAQEVHVPATGQLPVSFRVSFPMQAGRYKLIAEYADAAGEMVQSVRDFTVR